MNQSLLTKIININTPILITGPSGTGKSQMAQKIFNRSRINRDKFLVLHLASVKEDLLESELFGHKKGAFTGANENKLGYFQETGLGTLFLDEIGELSLESQKKLLYVLEEKKFTPVGSTLAIPFLGRIIMATNKDLAKMVQVGHFREDLYFRLNIFNLEIEEIGKNKEKLLMEIREQFQKMKTHYKKYNLMMGHEIEDMMVKKKWKGNFRELKNCLEYMVVVSDDVELKKQDFPSSFIGEFNPGKAQNEKDFITNFPEDYSLAIKEFEEWYLREMLNRFSGGVNKTARVLGISKTTLINKAKKYEINTLQIRADALLKNQGLKAA